MPGCTSIINLTYQDGSEGSPSNPAKYNNQDYTQLKARYVRRGSLFVDSTFPPDNRSLGDLGMPRWREEQVEWLRPAEILKRQGISDDAVFCSKGASRFDFGQGNVGNCWFLAAISALTFHKTLMVQVVPMDQSFKDYAGIFHFRFWRFGKWVDVVIDDHLPTIDNNLLSVRSKSGNEFWVPLLEKAYAKVCGTYADMNAGLPSEACKDFSGGVHMMYELREVHDAGHDEKLWESLSNATGCNSMICCGTPQKGDRIINTVANTGLVDAHAYSVTAVTEVTYYGSKVKLVRVMNPWGQTEWNGDWSDKSEKWNGVTSEDKEKCFDRDDGEFWMELEDFCRYFLMLFICCENPNFIDGDLSCQWQCQIHEGKWVAGRSAGGSPSNSTFHTNPQYRIEVTKIDRTEVNDQNILLSLMQKPKVQNRKEQRSYPIGVTVYKVPEGTPKGRLPRSFFDRNRAMKRVQNYTYNRDLIRQYSLQPGEYVVIPSTMKPYQSAEFVLSVFSKTDAKISPHDGHDDHDHEHEHEHADNKEEDKENLILPEIPGKKDEEDTSDPVYSIFKRYADQRGELSAFQLRKLLTDKFPQGSRWGWEYDTCRSLIALVDVDRNRRMTITEFRNLWKKIEEYKKHFDRADLNDNGTLSDYEVQKAIQAAGLDTNDMMVKLYVYRYSGYSSTNLESFITIMMRLEKTSNIFKDKSSDGVIHLTWDEWSSNIMYN
ncbi:calpain-1 catalytic subunit-like [Cheilinus undulatus]|uniref:calpain-1 catalytic subunit-like n=1 Tax=Cheilinus undulatus TaxID=241271 RepID=UPI001BD389A4|nr:calpain-1 catalytic subunit-like [Cheilinus undulatus]XP_041658187.1 calpain-1 catalytic subunit-like [Cheilinus undulatus]XP_041658188.1 calpain-1 catalytic subunit-like [Cheilinus undulatus]